MQQKSSSDVSECQRWAATTWKWCKAHAVVILTGALLLSLSLHFVNPSKPHCSVLSPSLVKALTGQAETQSQAAASKALKNGRIAQESNAYRSRMTSFKGHDLLLTVPANDEFVGQDILRSGVPYQSELLGPMMDLITPGSTVVDVGGNLGSFTTYFAAATGLNGRVYSFEPQQKMFQLICTNAVNNGEMWHRLSPTVAATKQLLLHRLTNVYPQNAALSFTSDTVHMSKTVPDGQAHGSDIREAESNGSTINYGGMNLGKGGEKVQSKTLDSYNLTGVSLIKIDAQGAEQLVIYGGRDTIKQWWSTKQRQGLRSRRT